jgi:single-strand DNA-binding protein
MKSGIFATVIGKTAKEAEMKYLQNGTAITEFSINVVHGKKGDDWQSTWVNCVVFGAFAEKLNLLPKGTLIAANGMFETQSWKTNEGEKKSKLIFKVNNIIDPNGIISAMANGEESSVSQVNDTVDEPPPF